MPWLIMNNYKINRVPATKGKKKEKEQRRPFADRVDELVDNIGGFFAYNPGYVQEGVIQIAVSATADQGTYLYAPDKYVENILVSKTPRKGADFFVAGLGASRFRGGMNVGKRCLYSRTYYVWKEDGHYRLKLLLNNGEQLMATKVAKAFDEFLQHLSKAWVQVGTDEWRKFRLSDGLDSFGRIRFYTDEEDELWVLICMPNSGAILNYPAFDVEIGDALKFGGYYTTRFLSFFVNGENLSPSQTLAQKRLKDDDLGL